MHPNASADSLAGTLHSLRPALAGLFFGTLTLIFGFGLGIVFGANEDAVKSRLKASATDVRTTVYSNDDVAIKAALDKSWVYVQRAHLHAGGLGTSAIILTLVTVVLGVGAGLTRAISLALGLGSLGYAVYWLLAAFRLPTLGSSGAAKESLDWLAMPSSGAVVVATVAVAVLLLMRMTRKSTTIEATTMPKARSVTIKETTGTATAKPS